MESVLDVWKLVLKKVTPQISLPLEFYMDEYEKVILSNSIDTMEDYLRVRRTGRGIRLNRAQKAQIWNVISEFRAECSNQGITDSGGAISLARKLLASGAISLPYTSVLVDELQDFGENSLRLIRAIAGFEHENDLFLVGDAHQRIFGKKVNLTHCGINTLGRSEILRINYRTTDEIGRFAKSLLQNMVMDDLDGGIQDTRGHVSLTHGPKPEFNHFNSQIEEYDGLAAQVSKWIKNGYPAESICITVRLNKHASQIKQHLNKLGINVFEIKSNRSDERSLKGVRLSTMHRIKGLEFDCIIIADANKGVIPLNSLLDTATDSIDLKEKETSEKLLLYVAATRARMELVVLSHGKPSPFLTANDEN